MDLAGIAAIVSGVGGLGFAVAAFVVAMKNGALQSVIADLSVELGRSDLNLETSRLEVQARDRAIDSKLDQIAARDDEIKSLREEILRVESIVYESAPAGVARKRLVDLLQRSDRPKTADPAGRSDKKVPGSS